MNSSLNRAPCGAGSGRRSDILHSVGEIMESTVQKSCWGVTARAVLGFGAVAVIAYLFGGI
jgi:hypothetical protein